MKMVFCNIKISSYRSKSASQIPPRAKALWPRGPGFWSMVEEVAFSNTPVAQGPANFLQCTVWAIYSEVPLPFLQSILPSIEFRLKYKDGSLMVGLTIELSLTLKVEFGIFLGSISPPSAPSFQFFRFSLVSEGGSSYCQMLRVIASNHPWHGWFWRSDGRTSGRPDVRTSGSPRGHIQNILDTPSRC